MTFQFQDRRGATSPRYRDGAEITVVRRDWTEAPSGRSFVTAQQILVCYATVFSVVTQRSSRHNTKHGCGCITWDQALLFFLLLWLEREKNNAWYIHLTSRQPPPNLHNLTSAWPVMLLANKRLPYRNQILARIMSLLKSILGKRKFLSTSMFRWRFDS